MKKCCNCGRDKPVSDFYIKKYPSGASGYSHSCKECLKSQRKTVYRSPEGRRRILWNNRKSRYGLTHQEFLELLTSQDNCCAICSTLLNEQCAIDHNHATGQVRGLLCHSCNTGIGLLKDSANVMAAAIAYLQKNGSYERSDTRSSQKTS